MQQSVFWTYFLKNKKRDVSYLNLNVSPSSEALPGEISNIPEKGYGWPP